MIVCNKKKAENFVFVCKFDYICQTEPENHTGGKNEPMKKLFRFLAMAMMAVTLCNCGENEPNEPNGPQPPQPGQEVEVTVANLSKCWELTEWSVSAEFPSDGTGIYLELKDDNTFNLYQKGVNFVGVVLFEGTYELDTNSKTITGTYRDGENWAADYTITKLTTENMIWQYEKEISTFDMLEEIPAEIKEVAVPADEVRSTENFRFL